MSKEEYGKTIKIFLPNGNTDNVKIASIANSTVQATLIPRNILDSINDYEEISSQGIYFLLDNDNNVYVGEAENVRDRIIQHNKSKDWWVKVITINVISINSPLTKADIKFLELLTYNKIEEAGRYKLDQTIPAKATVSRDRKADLMHIYEDIKMLVSVLSYPLFNPQRQTADDTVDEEEKLVFYMNRNNISASGEYTSEGFLLYAGSQLKDISTKSFIEGNSGGVLLKEIEEYIMILLKLKNMMDIIKQLRIYYLALHLELLNL